MNPPRVIVTRPLKLNLKGTRNFGQSIEDDIKNSTLGNGDFLLWLNNRCFELDNCLHLSISQESPDLLDTTSMGASKPTFLAALPQSNGWSMDFTLNQSAQQLQRSQLKEDVCAALNKIYQYRKQYVFQLYDFQHKILYKSEGFFSAVHVYADPMNAGTQFQFEVKGTAPLEQIFSP